MSFFDPSEILSNQQRMERERSDFTTAWSECARLVYPEADKFETTASAVNRVSRNQLRINEAHDPYTTMALADGVSTFESYVTPRGQRWQKLELGDESLMKKVSVLQWLERKELLLFKMRNDPESGFVGAIHDSAMSLFAFGPQSMWVDDRWDHFGRWCGLSYESEFIGDIWVERDAMGRPMRVHRVLMLTAEQALRKFGEQAPPAVRKAMYPPNGQPQRDQPMRFLHVIEPNRRFDAQRIDMAGKPWIGCYYGYDDDTVFMEGGYHSLPRITSAFNRSTGNNYGRSPTMDVLPLVRMAQEIIKDRAWGAELRLKPPLLAKDDDMDGAVLEIRPHGVTYGGLDDRGDAMFKEFLTAADASDAEKLTAWLQTIIDRRFYRDLLQLNRELKTHITATRTEEEKAEKGTLLAPLARQEQEWLSPMTQRELALMEARGLLGDMPDEVHEYLESAGSMGLRYDNGLTQLQEAGKSAAFLSLAGQVGALAQYDPNIAEEFKREYPPSRFIPELGRIAGVPASMRATDEEMAAWDQKKAQQAQLDQLLAAAPALAGAAKDAASAGGMVPAGAG